MFRPLAKRRYKSDSSCSEAMAPYCRDGDDFRENTDFTDTEKRPSLAEFVFLCPYKLANKSQMNTKPSIRKTGEHAKQSFGFQIHISRTQDLHPSLRNDSRRHRAHVRATPNSL